LFPELKQNLGGHKFNHKSELETVATGWLKTNLTDFYQKDIKQLLP
jgi:hypothetical protein